MLLHERKSRMKTRCTEEEDWRRDERLKKGEALRRDAPCQGPQTPVTPRRSRRRRARSGRHERPPTAAKPLSGLTRPPARLNDWLA